MTNEEIAQALIAEGDRRRSYEAGDGDGYGLYGEGLSREERDQWYEAAMFVRELPELRPHSNPDSNHLDLS